MAAKLAPGRLRARACALRSGRLRSSITGKGDGTRSRIQSGRPFAMTSMRRPSPAGTPFKLRSRSGWFSTARAPASLQMRATAFSRGVPRLFSTPARGQAARWSLRSSSLLLHLQLLAVKGKSRRKRRRSRVRSSAGGMTVSSEVGRAAKALPAPGPLWERSRALSACGSVSSKRLRAASSNARAAPNCQPWPCSPGSRSFVGGG